MLCDNECGTVAHVFGTVQCIVLEFSHLLGSNFSSLDSVEKTLRSELWEENISALLSLVKRYM